MGLLSGEYDNLIPDHCGRDVQNISYESAFAKFFAIPSLSPNDIDPRTWPQIIIDLPPIATSPGLFSIRPNVFFVRGQQDESEIWD